MSFLYHLLPMVLSDPIVFIFCGKYGYFFQPVMRQNFLMFWSLLVPPPVLREDAIYEHTVQHMSDKQWREQVLVQFPQSSATVLLLSSSETSSGCAGAPAGPAVLFWAPTPHERREDGGVKRHKRSEVLLEQHPDMEFSRWPGCALQPGGLKCSADCC